MPDGYMIFHQRVPWHPSRVAEAGPLGRHVRHDSRSLQYPWRRSGVSVKATLNERMVPIFNQGQVGSCTGNATAGAIGTAPLFAAEQAAGKAVPDENMAVAIYSAAETIDGDGPYPPNDNGSSGLSACQAAKGNGLIAGYLHCLSVGDVEDALQSGPVITGVNWYDSFDSPGSNGEVSISPGAEVRGGHEVLIRGVDPAARMLFLDNSWGETWGNAGSFAWSYDTMARLLSEQGDATVPVPLGQPVPPPFVS